jgi:hypothetical protein
VADKLALIIANTEYQDTSFAKLTAPGKDAEEFASVLQDQGLAAFNNVQVLLNEEERNIRRAIARFFKDRKRDDLLLLYFSGHGVRSEQGHLFLAATDTEISILEATGIPADFINIAMNNSRSQRQLLILDCCNSGAFAHGSKSVSAIGKSMGIAAAFEGSGFGRIVLTATDATQYAWEGDNVVGDTQKSVFTHFLIEGLKGEADRDGDGRINVDELYDYAYEQVVRRTPKQTPGKWSYKQQGDLILRENLKPRDVKPAPLPSEVLYYLDHPSSGVRSNGVEELIRLLDGKHLGLARAAEIKLLEIATNDDSSMLRKVASEALSSRGKTSEPPAETKTDISPPVEKSDRGQTNQPPAKAEPVYHPLGEKSDRGQTNQPPAKAEPAYHRPAEMTDFPSLGIAKPLTQIMTTYVLGDDLYDEAFGIVTREGAALGEYGAGISETLRGGSQKKVAALEIWLYDKNDVNTTTKVLMTEYAYDDPIIRARLEPKGQLVVVKPDQQFLLETATLQLLVTVVAMEYGTGTPPRSHFARITLELATWRRSGQ